MPFRLSEARAKIQFVTSAEMPSMIFRACLVTETVSNTVYIQHAVAAALARDLGVPLSRITDNLPPPRGLAAVPFGADRKPMTGSANTVEEVR